MSFSSDDQLIVGQLIKLDFGPYCFESFSHGSFMGESVGKLNNGDLVMVIDQALYARPSDGIDEFPVRILTRFGLVWVWRGYLLKKD